MPQPRLYTRIEYIQATEDRYLVLDANNQEGRATSMDHLQRDSPQWFAWLERLPSFHFAGKQGVLYGTERSEETGKGILVCLPKAPEQVWKEKKVVPKLDTFRA